MAWRITAVVFTVFAPYFLGKELCQHSWWPKEVVEGISYWVQGAVMIWLVLAAMAFWASVVLGAFWALLRQGP